MNRRKIHWLLVGVACSALVACSSSPKVDKPAPKKPKVSKIALVAVDDPMKFTVVNRGGPLDALAIGGALITKNIQTERSALLASVLRNNSLKLGEEMTQALTEQLTQAGYAVEVLKDVKRMAKEPTEIDFKQIKTDADAVLVAKFDEVGLYSGQFSKDFVPRLNLNVALLTKDNEDEFYEGTFYYGADARKATDTQAPSDPAHAYPSFDIALQRHGEVLASYRTGIQKVAALVAKQFQSRGI